MFWSTYSSRRMATLEAAKGVIVGKVNYLVSATCYIRDFPKLSDILSSLNSTSISVQIAIYIVNALNTAKRDRSLSLDM